MKLGLFGLPGAGKGTQAQLLSGHLSIPHVSTGDIFRKILSGSSEISEEVKGYVNAGKLVPDGLVDKITFSRLNESDCQNGFILDGYPRNHHQSNLLWNSAHRFDHFIYIDLPQEIIIKRLSGRRVCEGCSKVWHIDTLDKKDICPTCSSRVIQRPDDLPKRIEVRLDIFHKNIKEVVDFFTEKGVLKKISGDQTPNEVFKEIISVLN